MITYKNENMSNNDFSGHFQTTATVAEKVDVLEDNEIEGEIVQTPNIISLKLLPLTKGLHAKHGLRHSDFQVCVAFSV